MKIAQGIHPLGRKSLVWAVLFRKFSALKFPKCRLIFDKYDSEETYGVILRRKFGRDRSRGFPK